MASEVIADDNQSNLSLVIAYGNYYEPPKKPSLSQPPTSKFSFHSVLNKDTTKFPKQPIVKGETSKTSLSNKIPTCIEQVPPRLSQFLRTSRHHISELEPHPSFGIPKVWVATRKEFLKEVHHKYRKIEIEDGFLDSNLEPIYLKVWRSDDTELSYIQLCEDSKLNTSLTSNSTKPASALIVYHQPIQTSINLKETTEMKDMLPLWTKPIPLVSDEYLGFGPELCFDLIPESLLPTMSQIKISLSSNVSEKPEMDFTPKLMPSQSYIVSYLSNMVLRPGIEGHNWHNSDMVGIIRSETQAIFMPPLAEEHLESLKSFNQDKYQNFPSYISSVFGDSGSRLNNVFSSIIKRDSYLVPSIGLVTGSSGIGKSWLVNELAAFHNLSLKILHIGEILDYDSSNDLLQGINKILVSLSTQQNQILILDKTEEIFPKGGDSLALFAFLDALKNWNALNQFHMLVLCLSSKPKTLHSDLLNYCEFQVELPIPNPQQRTSILSHKLHQLNILAPHDIIAETAENCSGYLMSDLFMLAKSASLDLTSNASPGEIRYALTKNKRLIQLPQLSHHVPLLQKIEPIFFNQIGGLDDAKKTLKRLTMQWSREKRNKLISLNIPLSKGALLYGPPGSGKTLLGKALATEMQANFLPTRIPDLIRGEIGASENALGNIFRLAKSAAPCILFMDELDAMFARRENSSPHASRLCAQFALELDHLASHPVFLVATTNHPLSIDPSLLRPGRIDYHIYLPPPTASERFSILELLISKLQFTLSSFDTLKDFITCLQDKTIGFTGADLASLVYRAKSSAFHRLDPNSDTKSDYQISELDFLNALNPNHPSPLVPSVLASHLIEFEKFRSGRSL